MLSMSISAIVHARTFRIAFFMTISSSQSIYVYLQS